LWRRRHYRPQEPVLAVLAVVPAAAVVALEEELEVVVGQEPAPVAVMELGPAPVRVQGLVLVRVQPHRSALDLMRPSVLALVPLLAPEPPEALGWAPVPAHPPVPGRAGRLGTEPAMGPEMGPGTRASGLKTEPASERLHSVRLRLRKKPRDGTAARGFFLFCPSTWIAVIEHPVAGL
jgi:hypothetical protein